MKKLFIFLIGVFLLVNIPTLKVNAQGETVKRLEGKTRIETAIEISKKSYNSSNTVILVGYNGQVDALSGTLLARVKDAPILVTYKDSLPKEVLNEINRLKATNIIILGGTNAVSESVESSLNWFRVERIKGETREETAVEIAKKSMGSQINEAFLALGYNEYADALAIGPVSGSKRVPILLTQTKELSTATLEAIKTLNINKVNIIGGKAVVSESIEQSLRNMGISVERTYGDNRELTALNIAKKYNSKSNTITLANGYNYADALVGGYFSAKNNASILLTQTKLSNIENYLYIEEKKPNVFILGGRNSVRYLIEEDIREMLEEGIVIREKENNFTEPFETIRKSDPTLSLGKEVVIRKGVNGTRYSVDRVYYKNNTQIRRLNIVNRVTKKPIDEIIHIGTKR